MTHLTPQKLSMTALTLVTAYANASYACGNCVNDAPSDWSVRYAQYERARIALETYIASLEAKI
jgi:hypothetical protein